MEHKLKLIKPQNGCATKVYRGYGYEVSIMDEEACGFVECNFTFRPQDESLYPRISHLSRDKFFIAQPNQIPTDKIAEYAEILKGVSELIEEIKERYDELNTFTY